MLDAFRDKDAAGDAYTVAFGLFLPGPRARPSGGRTGNFIANATNGWQLRDASVAIYIGVEHRQQHRKTSWDLSSANEEILTIL